MYNIAFQAGTKASAKTDLAARNKDQETPMPAALLTAVEGLIDALGTEEGKPEIGLGVYGSGSTINITLMRVTPA